MRPALQLLHCFCGRDLLCIFSPHSLHLGLSGENCLQVAETGFVGWHWVDLETSLSRTALNPLQRCWGEGTLQHPHPWLRQLWGTPITVSQLPRRPESVTLRGTEGVPAATHPYLAPSDPCPSSPLISFPGSASRRIHPIPQVMLLGKTTQGTGKI